MSIAETAADGTIRYRVRDRMTVKSYERPAMTIEKLHGMKHLRINDIQTVFAVGQARD
jgi:hypothetical protein